MGKLEIGMACKILSHAPRSNSAKLKSIGNMRLWAWLTVPSLFLSGSELDWFPELATDVAWHTEFRLAEGCFFHSAPSSCTF